MYLENHQLVVEEGVGVAVGLLGTRLNVMSGMMFVGENPKDWGEEVEVRRQKSLVHCHDVAVDVRGYPNPLSRYSLQEVGSLRGHL
tara:strand:- start:38 stop:295 length:258 start_codon:yes stop_codon:yes gene_type:complete